MKALISSRALLLSVGIVFGTGFSLRADEAPSYTQDDLGLYELGTADEPLDLAPIDEPVAPAVDADQSDAAAAEPSATSEGTAAAKPKKGAPAKASAAMAAQSSTTTGEAWDPASDGVLDLSTQGHVEKQHGVFNYTYSFKLPSFRGLEPNLGLSYVSSGRLRGRPDALVGYGWKIDGLSVIERQTLGGGLPTYVAANDLYVLDGETLLACGNAASFSGSNYPSFLKDVDNQSASCRSSGDLTAQHENYRRIIRVIVPSGGSANTTGEIEEFHVYDPDGTQYIYRSVGALVSLAGIGGTAIAPTDPNFNVLFKRRFLLAQIVDAQREGSTFKNVVNFTYAFSSVTDGLTERPSAITYGGYRIKFGYNSYANNSDVPVVRFGVGSDTMFGRQAFLLRSVQIYDETSSKGTGSFPVRAYGLVFADAASSAVRLNRNLLSVTEFASDFVVNATDGSVTAGSAGALPATTFTYSDDVPNYN
ncbi:hypothetical protein, partial [Stagnihabitans tardus]